MSCLYPCVSFQKQKCQRPAPEWFWRRWSRIRWRYLGSVHNSLLGTQGHLERERERWQLKSDGSKCQSCSVFPREKIDTSRYLQQLRLNSEKCGQVFKSLRRSANLGHGMTEPQEPLVNMPGPDRLGRRESLFRMALDQWMDNSTKVHSLQSFRRFNENSQLQSTVRHFMSGRRHPMFLGRQLLHLQAILPPIEPGTFPRRERRESIHPLGLGLYHMFNAHAAQSISSSCAGQ